MTWMEIRVHSQPFLTRYKRCTNVRCVLSRSYGHEEFKNVNYFSVQKSHKALRAGQHLRQLQRPIEPSMGFRVHSLPFLAQYKGCTNVGCILSRSYRPEKFKNINPFAVHRAHKAVQAWPISTSLAAPYSEVNGNSRTFATLRSSVQTLH